MTARKQTSQPPKPGDACPHCNHILTAGQKGEDARCRGCDCAFISVKETKESKRLARLLDRRDKTWGILVNQFDEMYAKHPAEIKALWKTLHQFQDAVDGVTGIILNNTFEDKGRLIDRVMIFNAERSKEIGGGRIGGIKSGENRIAKRGDRIENHRAEFDRLCKTMSPRSAGVFLEKKTGFNFDAIARHFKKHPTE